MVADKISKVQSKIILSKVLIRSYLLIVLNAPWHWWKQKSRSEIGVKCFLEVKSKPSFLEVIFKWYWLFFPHLNRCLCRAVDRIFYVSVIMWSLFFRRKWSKIVESVWFNRWVIESKDEFSNFCWGLLKVCIRKCSNHQYHKLRLQLMSLVVVF